MFSVVILIRRLEHGTLKTANFKNSNTDSEQGMLKQDEVGILLSSEDVVSNSMLQTRLCP